MQEHVNLRKILKHYLPKPVRFILRSILTYLQRISRWLVILVQMRGASISDQLKLFTSALFAPIISFTNLTKWQDPQLLFNTKVVVFGIGRFSLRKYTDDLWHILPWRERSVLNVIRNNLKSGQVYVDAGANIGFYTVVASKLVGSSGKIIAIEMMPDTAKILKKHCKINNITNVEIQEYALSDVAGVTLTASVPIGKHGQASINDIELKGNISKINVCTTTLDTLLEEINDISVMKMDIEGAELAAIRGATNSLQKIKCFTFEVLGDNSDEQIISELEIHNFIVSTIDGRNMLARRA